MKKGSNSEKKDSFYDVDRLNTDSWTNGGGGGPHNSSAEELQCCVCYSVQASILNSAL